MKSSKDTNWLAVVGAVAGVAGLAVVCGAAIRWFLRKKTIKFLHGANISLPIRLVDKEIVSHDTILYTFGLPSENHVLGLHIGGCVRFHAKINGEDVRRSYTPITLDDTTKGFTRFVIKTYRKNVHPNFPEGGKMTQFLETLSIGDAINITGPNGNIHYLGQGEFSVKDRRLSASRINMICGGSGLTPMYQVALHILSTHDSPKISLIYANRTENDILLREELEKLQTTHPGQFRLWYTVESPPSGWVYGTGYIDAPMLEQHAYPSGTETVTLLCGPPPMIKNACIPNLKSLGHTEDRILTF